MGSPHTVLVVGAGAHAPYGMPTGAKLKEELVQRLTLGNDPPFCELIQQISPHTVPFDEFAQILRHSDEPTVDEVLADADDRFRLACKAAIALILFERERKVLHFQATDDWMATLLRRVTIRENACDDGVAVVTFNYDRLLEYRAIGYASSKRARRGIPMQEIGCPLLIEHVHGVLAPPLTRAHLLRSHFELLTATPPSIIEAARGIRVMREEHDREQQTRIANWLRNAERVLFLGFGFHDVNLSTLGIAPDKAYGDRRGTWAATCVDLPDERRQTLSNRTGIDFGFRPAHSLSAMLDVVPRMTGSTAGW